MSALTFHPRAALEHPDTAGTAARAARPATLTAAAPRRNSKDSCNSSHTLEVAFAAPDPALIDAYEERAAILEFDAGLCRPEAERCARIELLGGSRE
jgi:hypothetical protein